MNRYTACLVVALALLVGSPVMAQNRVSPHESIYARVGGKLVTVIYGRPYSKDPKNGEIRKIWGTLVPWDKAWRMGSDEATTLITQAPIMVGGTEVPAGAYTLYFIPSESGTSKLAISEAIGAWGIPVNEKEDLARVDVKKEPLDTQVDQFTMSINPTTLSWMWEKTKYSVDLKAK
jgi:hypothetical protein